MSIPQQIWPEDFAKRYVDKGYWQGETFGQMLDRLEATHGARLALVAGEARWSYAELARRARIAAEGFAGLGLVPGERVLVQLPNRAEFLVAVFGLFYAGLVPVYALPAHRETEVLHLAAKSGARAYVVADRHDGFDYLPMARKVLAEIDSVAHVIVAGEAAEFTALDSLGDQGLAAPVARDPRAVAFLQISGGSTGLPKLIPRTHDDYLYSVRASAEICGLSADSVYLCALPAAHNFPMSSPGYLGTLHAGGTVVMSPNPQPEVAFRLIAEHGVTITGLVPPLALLWMQAAPRSKHDLSSLEVLGVGGAKFIPEAAARVRPLLGCTLQQVFGMAEGLVNYTRLDDPEEIIINTQGRPISADDEVLVLDDAGNPVPEGEPGNLYTRGPYTIRGYYEEPSANARSFTADGFYRTGDVVRRLPGGYLEVRGRAGDHINRAGEKISAEEVEDHLIAHEGVFDAAVVSVPDRFLGEKTCAFVVRSDAVEVQSKDLKAFVRSRGIAEFKVPDQIVFVPAFETTAVGKVSRKALRAALKDKYLEKGETA
ncbi:MULTISPECIES: (2,3-dihydroxybenzoyl)adenylate synthase [unclassified Salipiger]|uniref:(2,3-dihydroxybenzoyl)adenylate synthase n=1 Tax=unclassified Salipiger TaxID=2640570 RepID=UPI0013BA09C3|nr:MULTISPECIES: AMP-binding protein [unclassified Salipiger]NDV50220.1 AMP-binding protein [Salipiger sp. PrR003]NDW31568.1 AMP-binding protein [Salipiger sp. PrR007]